jgi:mannose-1-phosphate guanylyltransferase
LARSEKGLITIGINPTRPATGYGYIEKGSPVGPGFKVAKYFEKPNIQDAKQYLNAGSYTWNAGIFVWPVTTILQELDRHAPDLMDPLKRAFNQGSVVEVFPSLKKISIDHAVMERTEKAYVIPGEFDWDDVGDWVALERLLGQETSKGNTVVGRHIGLETSRSIIYTQDPDDVIVTLGVEDLVVIKRGNTVLLMSKDHAQDIKKLLDDTRFTDLLK